jgi:transposase
MNLGHEVRLMPPAYVKPYVKRGKTDANDAEAICEAVTRPTMRFVPVKSRDQQAALALHRTRSLLVKQRTQLVNMMRSLLAEFGIAMPRGLHHAPCCQRSHPSALSAAVNMRRRLLFAIASPHLEGISVATIP